MITCIVEKTDDNSQQLLDEIEKRQPVAGVSASELSWIRED
jgi:hypothetical protein